MISKVRRSFATPAAYAAGGGELMGMDATSLDAPPERAALAQNLWRRSDGKVCKRKGIRIYEQLNIEGKIEWMRSFGIARFIFYKNKDGYGVLRREQNAQVQYRFVERAFPIETGDKLLILCDGEWLVVTEEKTLVIAPRGFADITSNFALQATPFTIQSAAVTVPLIAAGGSPSGKGQGVLPPNLLTPLVSESFAYRESDKEAKRNRFSLSRKPMLQGALDGADNETRKRVLTASATLEIRQEQTDDYGNTVSFWTKRAWSAEDNINANDGAFWVQTIHSAPLSYDGEDNIRITYFREELPETERLLSAETGALFGVGGLPDRLFAAAGERLFYSGIDDALYFGQLQYLALDEPILLLSGALGVLYALGEDTAWRIEGQAEKSAGQYALDAFFSVTGRFPIPRPYGKEALCYGQEMLFFSEQGVMAIHPSGVLDERTASPRSQFLWRLLKEEDPALVRLTRQENFLILAGQSKLYLFDLERRHKTATGQAFEAYLWTGINAEGFAFVDGRVCFFRDGDLYTFADSGTRADYHDEFRSDGKKLSSPIHAVWESVTLGSPARCADFFGLLIGTGAPTVMRILVQNPHGRWQTLYDYDGFWRGFCYDDWHYGALHYGAHTPMRRRKLKLSHRRGIRLRFENDIADSDFTLSRFAVEYK